MSGKAGDGGASSLSKARSAALKEERGVAAQRGDSVVSVAVTSDAGASQEDSGMGASHTMIPRLGMPSSSSGGTGSSEGASTTEAVRPTKYTSVFQSPVKNGALNGSSTTDTPSRLARFREANWVAKETKKRPRGVENETAIQPPKARIVTRLFADNALPESTAASQDDAGIDDASGTSDATATSTVTMQSSTTAPLDAARNEKEEHRLLERETEIAVSLHQDLVRDSARLKLTMDSLKEEIDYYFDVLARIEQVTVSARAAAERTTGTESMGDKNAADIRKLADGLQRIISAAKPIGSGGLSALSGDGAAGDPAPASK